jgi:hypothetical protein
MAGRPTKAARYCPTVSPPPLLGGDVRERLTERPLVPEGVLYVVLALAVFEVGRLHEDLAAVRPGPLAVRAGVIHPHHDRMGDLAMLRGRRSPRTSATISAPSPKRSCERWLSLIRTRPANPKASVSQATASRTSG